MPHDGDEEGHFDLPDFYKLEWSLMKCRDQETNTRLLVIAGNEGDISLGESDVRHLIEKMQEWLS